MKPSLYCHASIFNTKTERGEMTIFHACRRTDFSFLKWLQCDVSLISDYDWYYSCTRRSCVHNITTALNVHIYLEISTYLQAFYYSLAQRYLINSGIHKYSMYLHTIACYCCVLNLTLCFVMTS